MIIAIRSAAAVDSRSGTDVGEIDSDENSKALLGTGITDSGYIDIFGSSYSPERCRPGWGRDGGREDRGELY
jgi:hypothetical protein